MRHGVGKITERKCWIVVLWALILAKCFTLEYFVRRHGVPVNSAVYVWSLSLVMAAAASFVFLRIDDTARRNLLQVRASAAAWMVTIVGSVGLAAASAGGWLLAPATLPAALATLVGFGFTAHGLADHRPLLCGLGIGWWLGASVLFRTGLPEAFLVFGFLLIALVALPITLAAIRARRAARAPD